MKFRIIKKIHDGKSVYFIEQKVFFFFWTILCDVTEWAVKFNTLQECEDYIYKIAQESVEIVIPTYATKNFNN